MGAASHWLGPQVRTRTGLPRLFHKIPSPPNCNCRYLRPMWISKMLIELLSRLTLDALSLSSNRLASPPPSLRLRERPFMLPISTGARSTTTSETLKTSLNLILHCACRSTKLQQTCAQEWSIGWSKSSPTSNATTRLSSWQCLSWTDSLSSSKIRGRYRICTSSESRACSSPLSMRTSTPSRWRWSTRRLRTRSSRWKRLSLSRWTY